MRNPGVLQLQKYIWRCRAYYNTRISYKQASQLYRDFPRWLKRMYREQWYSGKIAWHKYLKDMQVLRNNTK